MRLRSGGRRRRLHLPRRVVLELGGPIVLGQPHVAFITRSSGTLDVLARAVDRLEPVQVGPGDVTELQGLDLEGGVLLEGLSAVIRGEPEARPAIAEIPLTQVL